MKFRKRPLEIEAFIWNGPNTRIPKEFKAMDAGIVTPAYLDRPGLEIKTLEGYITAAHGDFIIKGVKGEYYPCKADIFALTYEPSRAPSRAGKVR